MDFSKIKLIAVDMDGTLLNSRHELSPDFFPLFEKLHDNKVMFSVASGRQFFNLLNRLDIIKDKMIFIAENGSYVVYKGKELLVQDMAKDVVMDQLKIAKAIPDVYPILCGKKTAYIDNTLPEFIAKVEMYYDRCKIVNDLLEVTDDQFLKIALCDFTGAETNSYNYFKDKEGELQIKVSGKIWLDISHRDANKGKALKVVQEAFGISCADTMAFGDYLNDLELLQAADFSYAMANAHPDIKKVSKFIAKSNDENGVLEVLALVAAAMNG